MEKESAPNLMSEDEFVALLEAARHGDSESMLKLIRFFEKDISHLAKYIRLPKEDAHQSIITEMIELFRTKKLE